MKSLLAFLILGLLVEFSAAAVLSPEDYLYKISNRLTGKWPTANEYKELNAELQRTNCNEVNCAEDYFRKYIRNKMQTPEFYSESVLKTYEKFGFQIPGRIPFPISESHKSSYYGYSTELFFIYRIFYDNLSVDELFTSGIYWKPVFDSETSYETYRDAFYHIQDKDKWSASEVDTARYEHIKNLKFEQRDFSSHPNVAGLFSTEKFLKRYWNTPANGNRKRAAAIYKVMLCDPMLPALERNNQKTREEALALGHTDLQIKDKSFAELIKNRHANQKDCASCHQRLDPIANTMRPLELGISTFPAAGRLRYYTAFNELKDFPVANFKDLITKITQQHKYSECQLNWMINWIVGKDIEIHPMRYIELLSKFESNQRKVKSIIEELLLSKEFQGQEVSYPQPESFVKAKDVLQNCNFCHSSFLRSNGDQLKINLTKISFKLDLQHNGENKSMPPSTHWWEPSVLELETVKQWIQQGAPMVQGQPLLTNDEVKQLMSHPEVQK